MSTWLLEWQELKPAVEIVDGEMLLDGENVDPLERVDDFDETVKGKAQAIARARAILRDKSRRFDWAYVDLFPIVAVKVNYHDGGPLGDEYRSDEDYDALRLTLDFDDVEPLQSYNERYGYER